VTKCKLMKSEPDFDWCPTVWARTTKYCEGCNHLMEAGYGTDWTVWKGDKKRN